MDDTYFEKAVQGIVCDEGAVAGETREEAHARLYREHKELLSLPFLEEFAKPGLRIATKANPLAAKDGARIPTAQGLRLGFWMHVTKRGQYACRQLGRGKIWMLGGAPSDARDTEFVGFRKIVSGAEELRAVDGEWKGVAKAAKPGG